jgi:hypothetical protein
MNVHAPTNEKTEEVKEDPQTILPKAIFDSLIKTNQP